MKSIRRFPRTVGMVHELNTHPVARKREVWPVIEQQRRRTDDSSTLRSGFPLARSGYTLVHGSRTHQD